MLFEIIPYGNITVKKQNEATEITGSMTSWLQVDIILRAACWGEVGPRGRVACCEASSV